MIENGAPICFLTMCDSSLAPGILELVINILTTHSPHIRMRKQGSSEDLFKDLQLQGRGSELGLKLRAKGTESSMSLNDKAVI